jgi:pyrroloquinoline-quinone synthase
MNIEQQLSNSIEKWNLLKHPFYQAWSKGELPVAALQTYAQEYGAFIALLPAGWQALNDDETVQEEREHAELWDRFAAGLNTHIGTAQISNVKDLIAEARVSFADPVSALGALYAFEVQQPGTAHSKLEGLRAFYHLPASVEPYFEVHSHNEHEAAKLLARIEGLSAIEQQQAAAACEAMGQALWNALSGIYDDKCMQN